MAKKTTSRSYSQRTLKILFGRSGNQCAHPKCTNPVVVGGNEKSSDLVSAQISHILPVGGPKAPRATKNPVPNLNEPGNLLLLCPTHHGIVDGQYESYPSELLREWKRAHEAKVEELGQRPFASLILGQPSNPSDAETEIDRLERLLRQTRFYHEGRTSERAMELGNRLLRGDLASAPAARRAQALAWCARVLMFKHQPSALEFLDACDALPTVEAVSIARSFAQLALGNRSAALTQLDRLGSPAARSAMFLVAAHEVAPGDSLAWFRTSGLSFAEMDADGKYAILSRCLLVEQWDQVAQLIELVSPDDLTTLPPLLHHAALANLFPSVPPDLRRLLITQPPFDLANFPLSADKAELERRRIARDHYTRAAEAAAAFDCQNARSLSAVFALWLALRDPETEATARQELKETLRDARNSLGLVPLALAFALHLDLAAVEDEIARRISIRGGADIEVATARFALAFTQPNPASAADYLARRRAEMIDFLDPFSLLETEIDLLITAEQTDEAQRRLAALPQGDLTAEQHQKLEAVIAEGHRDPDVAAAEAAYLGDSTTPLLAVLVSALEKDERNPKFEIYARLLFDRTRALPDAERLAKILGTYGTIQSLGDFLQREAPLIPKSHELRSILAWHLYSAGQLDAARREIEALAQDRNNRGDHQLRVNIAITSGAWEALAGLLEEDWVRRDELNADQLLWCANLAGMLDLPRKRDFLFAAPARAPDDANVLARAYFLATEIGCEDDEATAGWLKRAAEQSGEDGPIKRMTLAELIERKPEWDRQEDESWAKVRSGELPLFVAGKLLNRTLVDLQLRPLMRNGEINDPRRRAAVPLFSGARNARAGTPAAMALDPTALLSIAFLDLFPQTLAAFERIVVPHRTLTWLMQERRRAAFHQPSRVAAARRLRDLIANDKLTIFQPAVPRDIDLEEEVGRDLSDMLKAARPTRTDTDRQQLVVRSLPIDKAGSLTGEPAEVDAYRSSLCSGLAVVESLARRGRLSRIEETRARAYLCIRERPREDEPIIDDDAILLLDDLTVSHFEHLGLLGRLADAGFTAQISRREADEANGLISYEQIGQRVTAALDNLRSGLASAIAQGQITVAATMDQRHEEAEDIFDHPAYGVLGLAGDVDVLVIDDRALNRHGGFTGTPKDAEIWCSLDLLDHLRHKGFLSADQWTHCRTELRRGGALFVPIDSLELQALMTEAHVAAGDLAESVELRAIRENILVARIGDWLQLPQEMPWLDQHLFGAAREARNVWRQLDDETARAKAAWLTAFLDVRDWAGRFNEEAIPHIARFGHAIGLMALLRTKDDLDPEQVERLTAWLTDDLLATFEIEEPEAFAWMVNTLRNLVGQFVDQQMGKLP
jgi:hypothetical protein